MKKDISFLCPRLRTLYGVLDQTIATLCGKTVEDASKAMELDDYLTTGYDLNDNVALYLTANTTHVALSGFDKRRNHQILEMRDAYLGKHVELVIPDFANNKIGQPVSIGNKTDIPNEYEQNQLSIIVKEAVQTYLNLDSKPVVT